MIRWSPTQRVIAALAVLVTLTGAAVAFADLEYLRLFAEPKLLVARIRELGILGPLLIIGLMCLAIVVNPLPSAPIAVAAGTLYGHTLGTVYIVLGAEIGAVVAFGIARWAGYDMTRRFFGDLGPLHRIGSQNTLTALVFVSRLVPFLSFDLVSYAAGLSPIRFWRFALATLLGLIPVSFVLAHFGVALADGNYPLLAGILLAIGLITLAPTLLGILRSRARVVALARSADPPSPTDAAGRK